MSITKRTAPSGSMSRPERFNLRLNASAWARTNRVFARIMASRPDLACRADAWEAVMLPTLEQLARFLPQPRPRDIAGQAEIDFNQPATN